MSNIGKQKLQQEELNGPQGIWRNEEEKRKEINEATTQRPVVGAECI